MTSATGTPSASLKLRKSYIKPGDARKNRPKTGDLIMVSRSPRTDAIGDLRR
jgi:hypothetical protein